MPRCGMVPCLLAAALVLVPAAAHAQLPSRGEVGAHFESLRIDNAGTIGTGAGARLSVALRRWFAVEGEFTVVPRDNFEVISSIGGETIGLIYNRRRVNALFGVKAGYRGDRVGFFGRLRPGVTTLTDRGVECLQACAAILIVPPQYRREFAMDIGGTLELYWTARSLMRIDVGDLMIRHRDDIVAPEVPGISHNLTTRIGAGFRF